MVWPGICLCFPEGTLVTTKRGVKKIEDLHLSDKVLTGGGGGGDKKWTTFYTWGHREMDRTEEFVVLKVGSSGKELIMSSEHLVFVAAVDGSGRVAKKAGQVCMGENLLHYDEAGVLQLCPVTEIGLKQLRGVYAPFTMSGDFLANGFLVGCYAHVEDHCVAHAALAPLRLWYKLQNKDSRDLKYQNKEGIHGYARKLMKIRDLLPHNSHRQLN